MRRGGLVALGFLAFAPVAWSFGDGAEGTGRSVEHVYAAGTWRPALTSDAGEEAAHPVTAISLRLTVDKTRQVLFLVRGGQVALVVATSTGATGNTPLGEFHVYRKVSGYDWVLYYPSYFIGGFAVHGYPDVPPYPASHGCARVPMWIAQTIYSQIAYGSAVYIYT